MGAVFLGWPGGLTDNSPAARYVRELVAKAPPLTEDQIITLRRLLTPSIDREREAWEMAHRKHRKGAKWIICLGKGGDSHGAKKRR